MARSSTCWATTLGTTPRRTAGDGGTVLASLHGLIGALIRFAPLASASPSRLDRCHKLPARLPLPRGRVTGPAQHLRSDEPKTIRTRYQQVRARGARDEP